MLTTGASLRSDNPIHSPAEDRLGRAKAATSFARQVESLDASEGVVVGVLGPWGSGKTSFVNLARLGLEESGWVILDFNPWMFSGADQLIDSFFVELAAQLRTRDRFRDIADALTEYGELFTTMGRLPVVGPWIDFGRGLAKTLRKKVDRRRGGIATPRERIRKQLVALDRPIAVVLDDIDRLRTSEIIDIFKLVRLTASFPNLVYILAFDRSRVESALAEDGIPGRDYLEKILQVAIDLPAVPAEVLTREIAAALEAAIRGLDETGPFDSQAWPDVFAEVVCPLIHNMRDVTRYAVAVRGAVVSLEGSIELVDLLALEAVRLFLPDVFAVLREAADALTTPSASLLGGHNDDARHKTAIENLLSVAGAQSEVVRGLIARVFPAAQRHLPHGTHWGAEWSKTWLKERRVAHRDILKLYLEMVASEGLTSFMAAERAFTVMDDSETLDEYLRSLPPDRLMDVIGALENWEEDFSPETVVPASTVLLNLIGDLPEGGPGMFDMRRELVVTRVVFRMLRILPGPADVLIAARNILRALNSHSAKLNLVTIVGYRKGAGHKLVDEADSRALEASWREAVRAASASELSSEWDLLRVLYFAKSGASEGEPEMVIPDDRALHMAMFRRAVGFSKSQSMGSRAVRRRAYLDWDLLVDLFGDEETLRSGLELARQSVGDEDAECLALVDRYLTGWRPKDFGDDD